LAAEAREFFKGDAKGYCFVHRRSCLKTCERANAGNIGQYRARWHAPGDFASP